MNNSVLPMASSASPERWWNFYGFGLFRFFLLLLFKMSVYTVNFIPLTDISPWYKVPGWIVSLIKSVYVCTESSPSLNSNSFKSFFILWILFSNKHLKLLNLMPETVKTGVNDKKQKYCYWSIRTITMPKSFEGFHCLSTMIKHIITGDWQTQIVGLDGFLENRNYFHLVCIWFCVETA